jgi:hypothetical protein
MAAETEKCRIVVEGRAGMVKSAPWNESLGCSPVLKTPKQLTTSFTLT